MRIAVILSEGASIGSSEARDDDGNFNYLKAVEAARSDWAEDVKAFSTSSHVTAHIERIR